MAEEPKTLADLKEVMESPKSEVAEVAKTPAAEEAGAVLQGVAAEGEEIVLVEPKIDDRGRSYATGKRKDAVARVWIKPGPGAISINGRELEKYFSAALKGLRRMHC